MSINLWSWGPQPESRFFRMAEMIKSFAVQQKPDVILVQEAVDDTHRGQATSRLLAENLGYQHFFKKRRNSDEGLAILARDDLRIESFETIDLQARYDVNDYFRMTEALDFSLEGQHVRVLNMHLAHKSEYSETRHQQIRESLEWASQLQALHPADVVVVGGDFNTGRAETYYRNEFAAFDEARWLHPGLEFLDVNQSLKKTWRDFEWGAEERVDHIFFGYSPQIQILEAKEEIIPFNADHLRLSDHNSILHSYQWKRSKD